MRHIEKGVIIFKQIHVVSFSIELQIITSHTDPQLFFLFFLEEMGFFVMIVFVCIMIIIIAFVV